MLIETVDDSDDGEGDNTLERQGLRRQEIWLLSSQVHHHLRRELLDSRTEIERQTQVSCIDLSKCLLNTAYSLTASVSSRYNQQAKS